ncbi:hypothetical protein Gohar_026710 [Gossypium harknessii]|uniref:Uncharacterized protein n=1 Tax=Gossypium harknessii TaxID=34285 RepID=A0A7J9HSF2_9ROSI|nr:hypothetical protein [Gossypium harknessii]
MDGNSLESPRQRSQMEGLLDDTR